MIGTLNEVKAVVKTNEQQKEVIENVAHYRHLFHPSYINNYSLVALTNASSLEEYKFDTGNKMSALNDAFFVMEEYLERCFDRYEKPIAISA